MKSVDKINNSSGFYYIYNKLTKQGYFGVAKNLCNRIHVHKFNLRNNIHHSKYLQNSYNKYGENSFSVLTFEYDYTKLRNIEMWAIETNSFNTDFNMIKVSDYKYVMPKEASEKIRQSKIGKKLSSQHRTNISIGKKRFLEENIDFKESLCKHFGDVIGENNGNSKLKEFEVIEIINRLNNNESPLNISKNYKVNNRTISSIKHKKTWKKLSYLLN